jgi:thiol-disulfide isomerase/thioredoxin
MGRNLLCSLIAITLVLSTTFVGRAGDKDKAPANSKDANVLSGELTAKDPVDAKTDNPSKLHKVMLTAGKIYRIDLESKDFDTFLRLEDPSGKEIAYNDDLGENNLNSRIVHKAGAAGEYRVIASTFKGAGKYTITIQEGTAKELLAWQVQNLPGLPKDDQKRVFAEYLNEVRQQGDKLQVPDVQRMIGLAQGLEYAGSAELSAQAYTEFGKVLAASKNPEFASVGKTMQGAARRAKLMGSPITVHGKTVQGKDFDWSSYKGKVVLVDFWATWCPPCKEEIPNIKKMYDTYHDRGFEVVAISLDQDGREKPTKYMEQHKLPWTCLFDREPGKDLQPLAEYYGIFEIPQAILVNREGRVISMNARGPELARLLEKELGAQSRGSK